MVDCCHEPSPESTSELRHYPGKNTPMKPIKIADFANKLDKLRVFDARIGRTRRLSKIEMKPYFSTLAVALASLLLSTPLRAEETSGLGAILPAVLHDAEGKEVDPATLKGKTVALYFSAHWCPPCRAFTPSLVTFRDDNADKDFEIVFVSLDNSEEEKKTYIDEMKMKWLTVPGAGSKEAQSLAGKFQIRGIPALVVLRPDGTVVTENGREDVMVAPDKALDQWKAKDPS